MQPSPTDLTQLKVRLTHLNPPAPGEWSLERNIAERRGVVKDLLALGCASLPLMPLVIKKLRTDQLHLSEDEAIGLFLHTGYRDLLDSWLEEARAGKSLSICGKIRLFTECGRVEYEQDLLEILYGSWNRPSDRHEVVEALGKAGRKDSLELLEYILPRIADLTNEGMARLESMPKSDLPRKAFAFEVAANLGMLEDVRSAISRIRNRQEEWETAISEERQSRSKPEHGQEEGKRTITDDEAESRAAKFLSENPGATAREVAKAAGIAQGRVPRLPAWRRVMAKRNAARPPSTQKCRPLTDRMLKAIGKSDDPAARLEAEEAVWQRLLEEAGPEERGRLHAMSQKERATLIQLTSEQFREQFEETGDQIP